MMTESQVFVIHDTVGLNLESSEADQCQSQAFGLSGNTERDLLYLSIKLK